MVEISRLSIDSGIRSCRQLADFTKSPFSFASLPYGRFAQYIFAYRRFLERKTLPYAFLYHILEFFVFQ